MSIEAGLAIDALFVFIAAVLVIFMQAGFSMLEAGLTRRKNVSNIMMKNVMDFSVGVLSFFIIGYALAFGLDGNGLFGWGGFFLGTGAEGGAGDLPIPIFFLFQAAFAGTAATIVSGAIAERTKFAAYLIASAVLTAFIYPVVVHWVWNADGWLANLSTPFVDFAGSTVVHGVGGWAALMGAIIVGARIGKYGKDGKPRAIPGHAIPLAVLGVFILWVGWYGFNPGSNLGIAGEGGALAVGRIAVTTTLAAATGALVAMATIWIKTGKPDTAMTANGALAGLVGITAGTAAVGYGGSIAIGAIAGVIVVFSVLLLDKKVDDPVGAISVHGVCGAWGTLAVGIFGVEDLVGGPTILSGFSFTQLGVQALGVAVVFAWVVVTAGILFGILKALGVLRVSPEDEMRGLDISEHGTTGYHDADPVQLESAFTSATLNASGTDIPAEAYTVPGVQNQV